jgi:small subunit ribosomal protein S14
MAKKSMIERDRKRIRLSQKYAEKRSLIKKQINEAGRPRGYFKDFGISRHVLREYAHQGLLPGVRKASW